MKRVFPAETRPSSPVPDSTEPIQPPVTSHRATSSIATSFGQSPDFDLFIADQLLQQPFGHQTTADYDWRVEFTNGDPNVDAGARAGSNALAWFELPNLGESPHIS